MGWAPLSEGVIGIYNLEQWMMNRSWWSTTASGSRATASSHDQSELGEHLQMCRAPDGWLLTMRGTAETLHRFAASRFVTTVVGVIAVLGFSSLVP